MTAILRIALAVLFAGPAQTSRQWTLRDAIRERGEDVSIDVISCGPPTRWPTLIQYGQLAVEGIISDSRGSLTPDETDVYTEHTMDVIRVLRAPSNVATAPQPGATSDPSPFVAAGTRSTPGATPLRVRFRSPQGRVDIDGHAVIKSGHLPILAEGQHVIVFAYYRPEAAAWMQFSVFRIFGGHVVPLDSNTEIPAYDSVDQFAEVLRNPPPSPRF